MDFLDLCKGVFSEDSDKAMTSFIVMRELIDGRVFSPAQIVVRSTDDEFSENALSLEKLRKASELLAALINKLSADSPPGNVVKLTTR